MFAQLNADGWCKSFVESNMRHAMNGYMYDNNLAIKMKVSIRSSRARRSVHECKSNVGRHAQLVEVHFRRSCTHSAGEQQGDMRDETGAFMHALFSALKCPPTASAALSRFLHAQPTNSVPWVKLDLLRKFAQMRCLGAKWSELRT